MTNKRKLLVSILISISSSVLADGSTIDKVYHPYVQPLEREIEWRMITADGEQKHRLGLGKSFTEKLFVEVYLIGENKDDEDLSLSAYEIETLWQLTEQGEYSADWGLLLELEKERNENNWEFSTVLLVEKEWGRWVGTANLYGIYEWGETIKNEFETALTLQTRYRYSRLLEPALEFYGGQDTKGLGPVLMGDVRFGIKKKLHWEAGAIFGLDSKTPDHTIRLMTEFEF